MLVDDLLARIPSELRPKAASICIYGNEASQMLLATRNDELYAISGFETPSASSPINCYYAPSTTSLPLTNYCFTHRIDVLCGKTVCELAHSGRYVLVRTKDGKLYSFSDNTSPTSGFSNNNKTNNDNNNCATNSAYFNLLPTCHNNMTIDNDNTRNNNNNNNNNSRRRSVCLFVQTCFNVSAHPLLQDKKIVQISCGVNHAAGLTSYGELFAWSIAKDGCCYDRTGGGGGGGGRISGLPSRTASPAHHLSTVITADHNHVDTTTTNSYNNFMIPSSASKLALSGCIVRRRSPFVKIVSYQDYIVALDEDGRLYEWQFDSHHRHPDQVIELSSDEGTLSCRSLTSESLRDIHFVHIAAGRSHVLAVSNSFAVYAWGCNDCGQLGLGSSAALSPSSMSPCQSNVGCGNVGTFVANPARLPFFDEMPVSAMKKIKAVAAHSHLDLSIAEAVTGDVYVWGDLAVGGFSACTSRPTWTKCRSVADALATYGRFAYTPNFIDVPYPTLTSCMHEAFDNPETSDIQFIVAGSQPIYAHRSFLQIRSPRFLAAFASKGWHQGRAVLVSVEQIPYAVVRTFILFLYTNEFQLSSTQQVDLDCDDLITIGEMAESCGETLLRKLVCDHIIVNCLTVENAAAIYSSVLKRPCLERENSLPSACLSFILANLVDVVRSENFAALDGDVAKKILVEAASLHKATPKGK